MSRAKLRIFLIFSLTIIISQFQTIVSKLPEFKEDYPEEIIRKVIKKKAKNPKVTNKSETSNFFLGKKITIDPNAPRNQTDSDDPFDDYTNPKYDKMDGIFNTDECHV